MAWFSWGPRWARRNEPVVVALARRDAQDALTAGVQVVTPNGLTSVRESRRALLPPTESWQNELWDRYDDCGEFALAVNWRANMMSRVRFHAGRYEPGIDEPILVDTGVAADLVHHLFDDVGGQSDALAALSTYLDVPGEGWVVGEHRDGRDVWRTCSMDEIRARNNAYEIIDENSIPGHERWRTLARDALVFRVYRKHRRQAHRAYSPARAALSAIRELDLVNRHIQAQYLSRLASAGIIILPDEVTFPTREQFNDAPDPFVAEWVETAKEAIRTPGTAAAVVPIPMRVPAEYVDKVQHIDFTLKLDEKIIEKRDAAKRRLAGIMNVPTDLLFDAGSINHWGLWQLEESAVKTYITPDFELIAHALTVGYLRPRMRALGEDPHHWTVWYDASEIITQPDISDNVIKAYDRFEVTGRALRREIGLDEDDAPTNPELVTMIMKKLTANPNLALLALEELTGHVVNVDVDAPAASGAPASDEDDDEVEHDGSAPNSNPDVPDTRGEPPLKPRGARAQSHERSAFTVLQAKSQHVVEFKLGGEHTLKHPLLCQPHLFSCPFTHATYPGIRVRPGTTGNYECTLSARGDLVIGRRVYPSDDAFIVDPPRRTNGVPVLN